MYMYTKNIFNVATEGSPTPNFLLQVYGFFTSDVIGQNFLLITASQVETRSKDAMAKSPKFFSAVLQCCWLRYKPSPLAGTNIIL